MFGTMRALVETKGFRRSKFHHAKTTDKCNFNFFYSKVFLWHCFQILKAFREGKCNVLISTCIGEEGLDIGEVDLIVCFDITHKSPVRMVQRMGRTGRKKEGRIVVLVTAGKEEQVGLTSLQTVPQFGFPLAVSEKGSDTIIINSTVAIVSSCFCFVM